MNNFLDFDRQIDQMVSEGKIIEAVKVMEENRYRYPGEDHLISSNILFCYREIKDYRKCFEIIDQEHEKGYFFAFEWEGWDPLRTMPGFTEMNSRNETLRTEYQTKSKLTWKVHLPADYDSKNKYPLLILLHGDGNGCNIEFFSNQWGPKTSTEKGWITAYVQSSQVSCYKGFGWTQDYGKSRSDIQKAYDQICTEYSVDENRIIAGGFSGGSMASLNLLGNGTLPLRGVITLCPNETEDTELEKLEKAAESGIRVVLLEGELSGDIEYHKKLMANCKIAGIPAEYTILPGIGHAIPLDIDEKTLEAIEFIIDGNQKTD
ncbi:MAG: hypothetical protein JEY99_04315 [Spirochaetales bacterium]|nr:hypothetical protein [Spirochaetales bacterium]